MDSWPVTTVWAPQEKVIGERFAVLCQALYVFWYAFCIIDPGFKGIDIDRVLGLY